MNYLCYAYFKIKSITLISTAFTSDTPQASTTVATDGTGASRQHVSNKVKSVRQNVLPFTPEASTLSKKGERVLKSLASAQKPPITTSTAYVPTAPTTQAPVMPQRPQSVAGKSIPRRAQIVSTDNDNDDDDDDENDDSENKSESDSGSEISSSDRTLANPMPVAVSKPSSAQHRRESMSKSNPVARSTGNDSRPQGLFRDITPNNDSNFFKINNPKSKKVHVNEIKKGVEWFKDGKYIVITYTFTTPQTQHTHTRITT